MTPLMTLAEVAELLRVDVETVRRWCRTGEIQAVKVGRVWRVKRETIEAIMEGASK
jgi:excisionase family DNA binding protein